MALCIGQLRIMSRQLCHVGTHSQRGTLCAAFSCSAGLLSTSQNPLVGLCTVVLDFPWTAVCRDAEEASTADMLLTRYCEQLLSGNAAAAGGSTDPAVRLDTLLKVWTVSATQTDHARSRALICGKFVYCSPKVSPICWPPSSRIVILPMYVDDFRVVHLCDDAPQH